MTEQNDERTEEADEGTVDNGFSSRKVEQTSDTAEETTTEAETEETTFPLAYVQKLRDESAKHRTRAQRADDLGARLHTALVAATGRLADPSDLAFDESHLDDAEALTTALDELLSRKAHLASRRPSGDVGQGASGGGDDVDLAGILRSRAG